MRTTGGGESLGGKRGAQDLPRLVDDPSAGPGSASAEWALRLLREAAPYQSPAGRKQRVQLGIGYGGRGRARALLRPAVAFSILIGFGCGALASAAIGHFRGWMARGHEQPAPVSGSATTESLAPRRPAHRQGEPPSAADATPSGPAAATAVALASHERPGPMRTRHTAEPAADDEAAPVLEAMRALRLEGNPVRARALLARYLDRHPDGALAEEALALSIEAAIVHHDEDAAALGAGYLRAYPRGSFGALARRAQAGAPPPSPRP